MRLLDLVLIALAGARLTKLTLSDGITAPVRTRLLLLLTFTPAQRAARAAGRPLPAPRSRRGAQIRLWFVDLLRCPWCVSVWWCAFLAVAAWLWGDHPAFYVPAGALAAAYIVGYLFAYDPTEGEVESPSADDPADEPQPQH